MRALNRATSIYPICVDREGLSLLLGCGKQTATKLARESGAAFKYGGRILYKVDVLREYVNGLTGELFEMPE